MEVFESIFSEYALVFPKPYHAFNSVDFNVLNQNKCDEIKFLLFKSKKNRLGLIGGVTDKTLKSPFSAPFGGFSFLDINVGIDYVEDAFECFDKYCFEEGLKRVDLTFPPTFYQESFISKVVNTAYRCNYQISKIDINHSFFLLDFNDQYVNYTLTYNARKNLKISFEKNLAFRKGIGENDLVIAYEVIKQNRAARGFPLRMSFDEVYKTSKILKTDCFIVSYSDLSIASAIVFHVAEGIVQVIYWGDDPKWMSNRTMNFLSFKLFEYYKETGINVVDIGPSSENSIPNHGLADFKESIGCRVHLKYTLSKEY